MNYLYHGVPEQMSGNELLPLNSMQNTHPALYALYRDKYKDREEVMERKIPLLDCIWNDVIQFLPMHPGKLFALQVKLGLIPTVPPYKFFEIDPSTFDSNNAVVYFKTAPGDEHVEVKWLRDVDLSALQDIPDATANYYKSLVGTNELPFNYQFVPHVLYKGPVDVSDTQIITLSGQS